MSLGFEYNANTEVWVLQHWGFIISEISTSENPVILWVLVLGVEGVEQLRWDCYKKLDKYWKASYVLTEKRQVWEDKGMLELYPMDTTARVHSPEYECHYDMWIRFHVAERLYKQE